MAQLSHVVGDRTDNYQKTGDLITLHIQKLIILNNVCNKNRKLKSFLVFDWIGDIDLGTVDEWKETRTSFRNSCKCKWYI